MKFQAGDTLLSMKYNILVWYNRYRIAGNFSEFETLTIFAIGYENVKVYSSRNQVQRLFAVDTPMPLQHYTGDALPQIGLIVKVRIAKTSFTPDSGKFLSAKVSRYTVCGQEDHVIHIITVIYHSIDEACNLKPV